MNGGRCSSIVAPLALILANGRPIGSAAPRSTAASARELRPKPLQHQHRHYNVVNIDASRARPGLAHHLLVPQADPHEGRLDHPRDNRIGLEPPPTEGGTAMRNWSKVGALAISVQIGRASCRER